MRYSSKELENTTTSPKSSNIVLSDKNQFGTIAVKVLSQNRGKASRNNVEKKNVKLFSSITSVQRIKDVVKD